MHRNFKIYNKDVFINCPFGSEVYLKLLNAMIFVIMDCGFIPRCAKERQDSSEERLSKIQDIIEESQFSIHDISMTDLDPKTKLPRLNMSFELGLSFGAMRYSSLKKHKYKKLLILDKHPHNYDVTISDLSGKDIKVHYMNEKQLICIVRDWLADFSKERVPGGDHIYKRYQDFLIEVPEICKIQRLTSSNLEYGDYRNIVEIWLKSNFIKN